MRRYAILSVTNKKSIDVFAKALIEKGLTILSTGGTAKVLAEHGVPYQNISDFTGQNEILGGRVKTLHPKVHAGILSRRKNTEDQEEMKKSDFSYIDVVAVNLYPFKEVLKEKGDVLSVDEMLEYIDIGGPTMLRASAKNFPSVFSVIDPDDYEKVIDALHKPFEETLSFRGMLASKVFAHISSYDLAIAEYLSGTSLVSEEPSSIQYTGTVLQLSQSLRYGENPHQTAGMYKKVGDSELPRFTQLQGKDLSFNNLNDISAALLLGLDVVKRDPGRICSVVIKHANPCGISYGTSLIESFQGALSCDPVSAFGGVIFFSHELDIDTANVISQAFYEVVIASKVSLEAKNVLAAKKNLRVLEVDFDRILSDIESGVNYKSIPGGLLLQSPDILSASLDEVTWVSGNAFSGTEKEDAELAWISAKHVTSNAITIASGGKVIGVGAGQMNRVDSSRIAVERAHRFGFSTKGAVVASDAFFPFPDSIEVFKEAGIGLLVQPGGSLKDKEVIQAAEDAGMKMILTGRRHFKH
jgi:phosphoribosylaminoimidazolecarboxamide formyltransferase / IMP cyclohydrolase